MSRDRRAAEDPGRRAQPDDRRTPTTRVFKELSRRLRRRTEGRPHVEPTTSTTRSDGASGTAVLAAPTTRRLAGQVPGIDPSQMGRLLDDLSPALVDLGPTSPGRACRRASAR